MTSIYGHQCLSGEELSRRMDEYGEPPKGMCPCCKGEMVNFPRERWGELGKFGEVPEDSPPFRLWICASSVCGMLMLDKIGQRDDDRG